MKRNDLMDIKKTDPKALKEKIKSLRSEIGDLVIDLNMGNVKNFKSLKSKRRDLAQILTILRQKEIIGNLEVINEKE